MLTRCVKMSVMTVMVLCSSGAVLAQDDRTIVRAYQTTKAPTLDGTIVPGEWDAAGPPIVVMPDAAAGFSAEDLSFQFRVMWEEPWTAYFLVEVADDFAMDVSPPNAWERDQVEAFFDGNDLEGNDDPNSFHWWASDEPYGKFGVSRLLDGQTLFEGNAPRMGTSIDDIFAIDEFNFLPSASVSGDAAGEADYLVEMAVSFEPMFLLGTFDGTPTAAANKIVPNSTVVKFAVGISDEDGGGVRDGYLDFYRESDWDVSTGYPNLSFVGPFTGGGPQLEAGDADQDLDFDQLDLVKVQIAAKYLTGQPATWGQGDWNGAPGGSVGSPPQGNGFFDQRDIIAALANNRYLKGPYAVVAPGGRAGDGQTSISYNPATGEVGVDAPARTQLTSVNIDSAAGIFTGATAQNLGGSFDNDSDTNIFKATFGSSFGTLSFGAVAQTGLAESFVRGDLTVVGSLAGGGALGNVDLIYVPEPSSLMLLGLGVFGMLLLRRQRLRRGQ